LLIAGTRFETYASGPTHRHLRKRRARPAVGRSKRNSRKTAAAHARLGRFRPSQIHPNGSAITLRRAVAMVFWCRKHRRFRSASRYL